MGASNDHMHSCCNYSQRLRVGDARSKNLHSWRKGGCWHKRIYSTGVQRRTLGHCRVHHLLLGAHAFPSALSHCLHIVHAFGHDKCFGNGTPQSKEEAFIFNARIGHLLGLAGTQPLARETYVQRTGNKYASTTVLGGECHRLFGMPTSLCPNGARCHAQ